MIQTTNNETLAQEQMNEATAPDQVSQDFKNAVLIVSVIVNLSVFTAWITLQVA